LALDKKGTLMTVTTVDSVDAARSIARLNAAYIQSRVLQSAAELGLFRLLAEGPADEPQIRAELGLHPRLSQDFLDALVGLEVLERDPENHYHNSDAAERFLVPGVPFFLGGSVIRSATHHYAMWGGLTQALRDGAPTSAGFADKHALPRLYRDAEATRLFLNHMDAYNGFVGAELVRRIDWSARRSFLDVGGARGNVAAQLVQAHPHLTGGVFDLPDMEPFFTEHMASLGTGHRVTFHAGDFFEDALPRADVVMFGHVLHDWPESVRRMLLAKTYSALAPGGAVLVYDQVIDDERRDPHRLLQSLNVRLVREGGSEFTAAQCAGWMQEAGFAAPTVTPLDTIGFDAAILAVKP
jgi:hypothetical protein